VARAFKSTADAEMAEHRKKLLEASNAAQAQAQQVARITAERDAALRQAQALQKQVEAALGLSAVLRERDAALAARSALEAELAGLRNQFAQAPKHGDLDALRVRIGELDGQRAAAEREVRDLRAQIEAIPDIAEIERARDAAISDRARLAQMLEGLRAQLSVNERTEWRQPVVMAAPEVRETNARLRISYLASLSPERLDEELRRVSVETKPIALVEPLTVHADDLRTINGVTPAIERWLNGNGLFFYWQFATLDGPGAAWLVRNMPAGADSFVHDHWIAQAARLARA
jgi:predicted flap endonuclease-1-like 5' DNA nuclease